jgi:tetratricopeptide (TPR) repeat protein
MLLAATVGCYQMTALANGGGMAAPAATSTAVVRTPEALAKDAYNSGISHRDKGDQAEADMAKKTDVKDKAKALAKAQDEYTKGFKDFEKATQILPNFYQAYNGMGYTSRKTGDYPKALDMYNKALSLAPGFPDAIEYRAVAFLKLNRIDDAKAAYLDLFARDRKNADDLMKEMTNWVADRQANPNGVDPAIVSSLNTWIQERAKIATTTSAMALTGHRSIWD